MVRVGAVGQRNGTAIRDDLGLHALWQRRVTLLACLGASLLPCALWQAMLFQRYSVWPLATGPFSDPVPLRGILGQLSLEPGRLSALLFVALPSLAFALYAGWRLYREPDTRRTAWLWLVLTRALALLFLPAAVHDHIMHAGRNAAGMVVSVGLAMPTLPPWLRRLSLVGWVAPSLAWLVPILRWAP